MGDGARLPFRAASFDGVTAFMSLMDVATPEQTLCEIARVLRPGGFTQFSIVHPATSTPIRSCIDDDTGLRHALAIGDYFYQGPLTETWTFGAAPAELAARHDPFTISYARLTLAGWINAVVDAGLVIEAVDEPHADEQTAAARPEVADTRIAPYFLIMRAGKPLRPSGPDRRRQVRRALTSTPNDDHIAHATRTDRHHWRCQNERWFAYR